MNKWSIDKLQEVWEWVEPYHHGQFYGGAQPNQKVTYLQHIGSVTMEVLNALQYEAMEDSQLAITAALLHDTIEDTTVTYELVWEKWGQKVADAILALTKNDHLDGKEKKMLDSLERILQQPKEVGAVKMADRICNLSQPPHYWSKEKIAAYRDEAKLIYSHLKDCNTYLATRLLEKIERYQQFM